MATTEVHGHTTLELQRNVIRRVNVGDIVTRSAARAPGDPAVVGGARGPGAPAARAGGPRLAGRGGGARGAGPACCVEARAPLTYLYRSGGTAAPKGVVGSHLAIYLESTSAVMDLRFGPEDR